MMVFPAYSSLQNRTTARFGCAVMLTNSICAVIYLALAVICVFLYGENVQANIIRNIASRSGWSSITLRAIFCMVLLMHIPYVYHPFKEAIFVFN
jgi:hypothetical protein